MVFFVFLPQSIEGILPHMRRLKRKEVFAYARTAGFLLCLLLVTFLFARGAWRMYSRFLEARTAERGAQAELEMLQAHRDEIARDTERLSSNRGLEEELRRRYGVALPGEGVIEIHELANATTSQEVPQSPLQKLFNWFF